MLKQFEGVGGANGGVMHKQIVEKIRSNFIDFFVQTGQIETAGITIMWKFTISLTEQDKSRNKAYADLVAWRMKDDNVERVIIEVGELNNICKWRQESIIHVGFDWSITPIRCDSLFSKVCLEVVSNMNDFDKKKQHFQLENIEDQRLRVIYILCYHFGYDAVRWESATFGDFKTNNTPKFLLKEIEALRTRYEGQNYSVFDNTPLLLSQKKDDVGGFRSVTVQQFHRLANNLFETTHE